jgi:ribosome-binding protein aMBF1 (putative translation factor)
MDCQDWTPVVIHNKQYHKHVKEEKQNPAGTKDFFKLNEDDIPILGKISIEQCNALKEARAAKGITQKNFAKSMNINVAIIQEYENGTIARFNKTLYNNFMRRLGVQPVQNSKKEFDLEIQKTKQSST